MNTRVLAGIFVASFFALSHATFGADNGWSQTTGRPSDLWFGNSSTTDEKWFGPRSTSAGPTKTASSSSWFPWSSDKSKKKSSKSKEPSMMQKVTNGTKSTWNKTVSFLNPFDNVSQSKPAPKEAAPKDDVDKPKSVHDFLRLPKP